MKKYSLKLASLVLFFAMSMAIGMEYSPKVRLKNGLNAGYVIVCVVNDVDTDSGTTGKRPASGEEVILGDASDIHTLKVRQSGMGTEKGLYKYDYLTEDLKNKLKERASHPNKDLLVTVTHHYYIPKIWSYEWEWVAPKGQEGMPTKKPVKGYQKLPELLQKIVSGQWGRDYAEKAIAICNADYTRVKAQGLIDLCNNLINKFEVMLTKVSPKGSYTYETKFTEEEIKQTINMLYKKLQEWQSRGLV